MQFLQVLQNKMAPEQSLKLRLHRHLARAEPARSLATLHASSVTKADFCARRNAIMVASATKPKLDWVDTSLAVTYAQGRMLQNQVVHWLAEMGAAVGDWKCVSCGKMHTFQKRPVKCDGVSVVHHPSGYKVECGAKDFHPVEIRFLSLASGISGGIDVIASIGTPRLRMVEIKTMKGDDFRLLKAPLAEHRTRTSLYLRLVAESDHPMASHVDDQIATLLYVSKGHGIGDPSLKAAGLNEGLSPFKEFTVQRDDALTEPLVSHASSFTAWRYGKGGMPGRICEDPAAKLAKKCPVAQYCFGTVFVPGKPNPNPVEVG